MQQVMGAQHPTVLKYIKELDKLFKVKKHKESQEMEPLVCMHKCLNVNFDPHCQTPPTKLKLGERLKGLWNKLK